MHYIKSENISNTKRETNSKLAQGVIALPKSLHQRGNEGINNSFSGHLRCRAETMSLSIVALSLGLQISKVVYKTDRSE